MSVGWSFCIAGVCTCVCVLRFQTTPCSQIQPHGLSSCESVCKKETRTPETSPSCLTHPFMSWIQLLSLQLSSQQHLCYLFISLRILHFLFVLHRVCRRVAEIELQAAAAREYTRRLSCTLWQWCLLLLLLLAVVSDIVFSFFLAMADTSDLTFLVALSAGTFQRSCCSSLFPVFPLDVDSQRDLPSDPIPNFLNSFLLWTSWQTFLKSQVCSFWTGSLFCHTCSSL